MIPEAVVCPYEATHLSDVLPHQLVVRVDGTRDIAKAISNCAGRVRIRAVMVRTQAPLSALEYSESWGATPVLVSSPSMGSFKEILGKLDVLSKLNVRLLLPASNPESYVSLQILSSLGVGCGIRFDGAAVHWEQLNDLLHYAMYTKIPHGPIEPFDYVASRYASEGIVDFGDVYYENPLRFAHVDRLGRVALSVEDASQEVFVGQGAAALEQLAAHPHYQSKETSWHQHFLERTDCSYCPAWRVCLGKFAGLADKNTTCRPAFAELLSACERHSSDATERDSRRWPY